MHFDDRIATVMALAEGNDRARVAKWRQLVDVLAQMKSEATGPEVDRAFDYLRSNRSQVDPDVRRDIARSLAGRDISPLLFAFFAEDAPAVAAPLISGSRLSVSEWIDVLPHMSPTSRSLLRNRRDLSLPVRQALAAFGSSDFALAGGTEAAAGTGGEAQIRELVARIEAFRKQRGFTAPAPSMADEPEIDSFRWEADADGIIRWIGDAPRGALVGQTIAVIAGRGQFGVDGQAAGAFEKRAPFRDARFRVAGSGPVAGDWRISGVPFFDPASGAFRGYRGSARRPRVDEVARSEAAANEPRGLFGTDLPADALRQLIHELRTPLNAIVGFAEMIGGQYLGPAGSQYRSRAAEILEQATRLLSAVDDLDTAARIESRRMSFDASSVDAVSLLCRLHDAYERVALQRNARIAVAITQDLPAARVEQGAAERMFARMLAATIGLARDGETISASMGLDAFAGQTMLCLAIDRPQAIAGLDEAALLDPGYSPDGDWPGAPALGLGFALRLVRNLAEAVGGALSVSEERFSLYLPVLEAPERSSGQGI